MQAIPEEKEEVEGNQKPNTMEDFWRPIIQEEYSTVRQPAIEANNFELKPALITMLQQHQFTGHPSEDPNEHMGRFMRMAKCLCLFCMPKLFPSVGTTKVVKHYNTAEVHRSSPQGVVF